MKRTDIVYCELERNGKEPVVSYFVSHLGIRLDGLDKNYR